MDLLYFLKALYRKKWIILLLSLLATITAFLFLVNKKPLFESVAQFSTGFTSEKVKLVDGTSAVDLYTIDIKFDNVIETIKSPQVISRISYNLMLHDLLDSSKAYRKPGPDVTNSQLYKEVDRDTAKKILLTKLAKGEQLRTDIKNEIYLGEYLKLFKYDYLGLLKTFDANRVDRTDYLNIVYRSENPDLSAWVVNAAGNEFLNYYRNLNTQRTDTNSLRIKELLTSQKLKVDSLGEKLVQTKKLQGSIDPESLTTSAMGTVTELESTLAEQTGKYNEHSNRVSYLRTNLKSLQAQAAGSASTDEIVRLGNRKNDLVEELNRKGGNDAVLQKQINDLRSEIASKSSSGSSKSRIRDNIEKLTTEINEEEALMNASRTTIADYTSRIRKYRGMTNVDVSSGVKMDIIGTQLEIENKQLQNLMERNSQAEGLAKDDPTSNFIQTRIGQPAVRPESKKTLMKMILAGISVFFLSSVVFLFLQIFDSSVKTPVFFNRLSKLKASNVLNRLKLKGTSVSSIVIDEQLDKKEKQKNLFKNNIRKLRFELLKSNKQVFLFTSTQNQSGKSTVIEALAVSLLLSNKKVLIIDLNFANNSLTETLNANVFIEDISVKKISTSATSHEQLFILGCRSGNKTPSEALSDLDLNMLIDELKQKFDFILIEGAALNYYADSKELSQYAEGVFIVFSADSTITEVDTESMKFVSDMKEKNHGVILNKVLSENINS
ncbi:MAG: division plane positioning ATPase MipZ [Ferruginibacter sp.]